jgi:hypothetical protein
MKEYLKSAEKYDLYALIGCQHGVYIINQGF